jgi:hypothetical protein
MCWSFTHITSGFAISYIMAITKHGGKDILRPFTNLIHEAENMTYRIIE